MPCLSSYTFGYTKKQLYSYIQQSKLKNIDNLCPEPPPQQQQINQTGRIPPNSCIYEGIQIQPGLELTYKTSIIDSINDSNYTQNQRYSYIQQNKNTNKYNKNYCTCLNVK
jgi:hypothetical protein